MRFAPVSYFGEAPMGDVAAISGVLLLLAGVLLFTLVGGRRSSSWATMVGIMLVVLGLGVELVGAVAAAA